MLEQFYMFLFNFFIRLFIKTTKFEIFDYFTDQFCDIAESVISQRCSHISYFLFRVFNKFVNSRFSPAPYLQTKKQGKTADNKGKNADIPCFILKMMVFVDSKFLRNVTPANSEGNLYYVSSYSCTVK
jgi:hypothetical protein